MPDQSEGMNNRDSTRFSVNLTVECYASAAGPLPEGPQDTGFDGVVQNISDGGACIVTRRPLRVTDVLKVAFPIQSSISSFISTPPTLAEVQWTHPSPEGEFISGLRFLL